MIYILYYLIIGVILQLIGYLIRALYNVSDRDQVKFVGVVFNQDVNNIIANDDTVDKICNSIPTMLINVVGWPVNVIFLIILFAGYIVGRLGG